MKTWIKICAVVVSGLGVWLAWHAWQKDEPRRLCVSALEQLDQSLRRPGTACLETIVTPANLKALTPAEQSEFIHKALRDEVTPEGIRLLKRKAQFGKLSEIFPAEADHWAAQAGVPVTNCVAFKLDQNGMRTEVVLLLEGKTSRIIRCNNVKQLAGRF